MADTQTPSPAPRLSGNRAGRYFFMAMLGLVIGVVGTVMAMRAWQARQDPYPHALMNVMQAHASALRQNVAESRCGATDTIPHLTTLRHLANDFDAAFPGLRDEAEFGQHAAGFRAALDASLAAPPLNCAGVQAVASRIGESCKACHTDYAN